MEQILHFFPAEILQILHFFPTQILHFFHQKYCQMQDQAMTSGHDVHTWHSVACSSIQTNTFPDLDMDEFEINVGERSKEILFTPLSLCDKE